MRPLVTSALVALCAGVAASAGTGSADILRGQQWGGAQVGTGSASGGKLGAGPTPMPRSPPPGAAALDRDLDRGGSWVSPDNKRDGKPNRPRRPRDGDFRRKRPFFFFDDDDDDNRIIVVPAEPREAPEPEEDAPEQAAPPPPPDPRGPKFVPARGASVGTRYTVGEPLPKGVPFVTLDWNRYELPEPPPGLVYARVEGDVLLIDPATRVVERRVAPSKLKTTEAAGEPG